MIEKGDIMYKVIPWDDQENIKYFDTFLDALQYGNTNYGSRYDLLEIE